MADIVLINPRFEPSYWGLDYALPILGRRANMPVAALPLIAALTPAPHSITLIDENVTPIDFERCARADIVGVTGMIVQRRRMREILGRLKERGVYTVVGGPWVSVSETYFDGLADVVFVGEAEQTWPRFLEDWQTGTATARYQQDERTDMTTVPLPRFDLVDMRHYAFASLQFSRGCPFRCEFCDIIVVFGRRPRIKNPDQVVAELDALRATGARIVFVVDDNLVGNKTAIKPVLQAVVDWQVDKGYPLTLFTEASLDLAEDEELMRLMVDANIRSVFVGIETPNEASLRETKKLQNIRPGVSMVDRIHAIQRAGMEVWSGMIIGFDSDDATIFDAQRRFVRDARIVSAMVGMLQAIPSTPLYDRLDAVDRLDHADEPAFGTNVIPKQLGRAELQAGYLDIVQALSEPNSYFDRLDSLYLDGGLGQQTGARRHGRQRPLRQAFANLLFLTQALGLFARLMIVVPDRALRREYRRRIFRYLRLRGHPSTLFLYVVRCAMHFHAYVLARRMASGDLDSVNSF